MCVSSIESIINKFLRCTNSVTVTIGNPWSTFSLHKWLKELILIPSLWNASEKQLHHCNHKCGYLWPSARGFFHFSQQTTHPKRWEQFCCRVQRNTRFQGGKRSTLLGKLPTNLQFVRSCSGAWGRNKTWKLILKQLIFTLNIHTREASCWNDEKHENSSARLMWKLHTVLSAQFELFLRQFLWIVQLFLHCCNGEWFWSFFQMWAQGLEATTFKTVCTSKFCPKIAIKTRPCECFFSWGRQALRGYRLYNVGATSRNLDSCVFTKQCPFACSRKVQHCKGVLGNSSSLRSTSEDEDQFLSGRTGSVTDGCRACQLRV